MSGCDAPSRRLHSNGRRDGRPMGGNTVRAAWVSHDELEVRTGWYERGVGALAIATGLFAGLLLAPWARWSAVPALGAALSLGVAAVGIRLLLSTDSRVFRRGSSTCERTTSWLDLWETHASLPFEWVECVRVRKLGQLWLPKGYRVQLYRAGARPARERPPASGPPARARVVLTVASFVSGAEAESLANAIAQLTGAPIERRTEVDLL
ncbi:hypothetical protein ACFL09_01140 [Planctomycetota bacterium]